MIHIRRFKPDDIYAVINLAHITLPERYNPVIFNQFYEAFPDGFLVAESHHKIIGFLIGVKTPEGTARVVMLAVAEPYRRRGIGSSLLRCFIDEIKKRGINIIRLETRVTNKQAVEFYKKHGFVIVDRLYRFYQNGDDGYLFEMRI
ncbi:MAG: GNAT family N-acetyltransferase [Candidatus Thermoplasmatota archaeon]